MDVIDLTGDDEIEIIDLTGDDEMDMDEEEPQAQVVKYERWLLNTIVFREMVENIGRYDNFQDYYTNFMEVKYKRIRNDFY